MKKTIEKENYLKTIYKMEEKGQTVTVTSLSRTFGVSKSTVSNMIKKLVIMDMIDSQPYKPILLSSLGRKKASEIIYKHRLIELYLVQKMNFELDEVHEIAEEVEHITNAKFFKRIQDILGAPDVDPHGSAIPKNVN